MSEEKLLETQYVVKAVQELTNSTPSFSVPDGYVSASDTYVEHLHSTDDITAAGDIAGRAVSASGRVDGSDFNTDGSLVFKGCTMAYDPAARTVTFTAAGRSVTLSLR